MEARALPFAIAAAMGLLVAQALSAPLRQDPEQPASPASRTAPTRGVAYYDDGFNAGRSSPGPTDPYGPER